MFRVRSIIWSVIYSSRRVSHIINIPSGNAKHYAWNIVQRTAPATAELRECFRCEYAIIVVLILINAPAWFSARYRVLCAPKLPLRFLFRIKQSDREEFKNKYSNIRHDFFTRSTSINHILGRFQTLKSRPEERQSKIQTAPQFLTTLGIFRGNNLGLHSFTTTKASK